ncbi:hypothetical protein [Anaerophilus nitritogenes]|uniref:hypothetical protein n=1 Tax=Anaerophilus nitritogenes TaxID=2498136 RepID=UPI00101DF9EF|nr:hypothetical protein [Anaerophilus nitritogenes]
MSRFNWVEGTTKVSEFVKAVTTDLTNTAENKWELVYPKNISEVENTAIIKTKTSFNKEFYLKIQRPTDSMNYVLMQIGTGMNDEKDDLAENKKSNPARFAWYRENNELYLGEWLPVQYWISFSSDFINIVIQGDPSPDEAPYNNYLISYAYIGALEGYEGADEDTDYNFGLTVSSDAPPTFPKDYGNRTASAVTDIALVGTRTGTPYQAHYPGFHTSNPWMDKNFISGSAWTHKYHFSEVTVIHAYDRERGKLQNVLVGDRSAIFHLDELIQDKGTKEEKVYKMFNINAPYNFLNNGPNVLYGIAIRKS